MKWFPKLLWLSFLFVSILPLSTTEGVPDDKHGNFLRCLSIRFHNFTSFSQLVYTQNNSNYSAVLDFDIINLRFEEPTTPKPLVIVTPTHASHIQATVFCAKKHGLQIRTRSGGHDFEGLSYVSHVPFVVIDLINLRSVDVDVGNKVAWVQAGATLGDVYYNIAKKSKTLGFPAGICPTVGVGGHISGGGYGSLMRKYGLAADHVLDALLIDANGRVLNRNSMGEDLFWAIRGGGGGSFGIILAWKFELVPVPETVTVFTVNRTSEQNATTILYHWQSVANKLTEDIFIHVFLTSLNSSQGGKRNIQASFNGLFLGRVDELLQLMQERFPQLGISKEDCSKMTWIESVVSFAQFPKGTPLEVLLNRTIPIGKGIFKIKSDYVTEPISENALERILNKFFEPKEDQIAWLNLIPYGGKMAEIPETALPFPHRAGRLYKIQYLVFWTEKGSEAAKKHKNWTRMIYKFMAPYVSKSPREAYINYRDLDIGTNNIEGYTSYNKASVWGFKYFKNNFYRLAQVKTKVDPTNFFRHEQSIPTLSP